MNKDELITDISTRTGFTKKDCVLLVDVMCECISEALSRGEQVKIVNFGVFKVRKGKARTGKNFADNTIYPIPARRIPTFIPGERLKEVVGGTLHAERKTFR